MGKKEKLNLDVFEEPVKEVDLSVFDEGEGEKKKPEPTPLTSLSPSADITSESTVGASASQGLPVINEGINPPGVLQPKQNPLQPKITVETQGLSAATAPSYQTTGDVNAEGEVANPFAKGVAQLGASLARTPAYLADVANRTINTVVPGANLPSNTSDIENPIATGLETKAKQIGKSIDKNYLDENGNPLGASDYFDPSSKHFDISKGFTRAANSVAEAMPVTLSLMAGNALGASSTAMAIGSTPVFSAQERQSLKENNPEMTDEQINNVSAISGALESVTENMFGNVKLGSLYKNLLVKEGADVAKKTIGKGVENVFIKALKPYVGNMTEEVASEMANQYLNNLNHIYVGGDDKVKPFDGVMEAGIIAIGSSGTLGAPTVPLTALGVARENRDVKKAQAIKEQQDAIKKEFSNPLVSPETKKTLVKELEGLNAEEDAHVKEMTDKHEKLPADKKTEIDDLLKKNGEIASAALDQGISKEAKEAMQSQIDKNYKVVGEIYKGVEKQLDLNKKNGITEDIDLEEHKDHEAKALADLKEELKKEQQAQKEKELAKQEAETKKQKENATEKGRVEESSVEQHQNGDESGKAAETSSSDSPEQSGEKQQEKIKGFTEAETINEGYENLKEKLGEKKAKKYFDQVDALVNPNENTVVEYRPNGLVTKEGDKYTFHALSDTDLKKWRLGFNTDVTDQFVPRETKEEPVVESSKKSAAPTNTLLDEEEDSGNDSEEVVKNLEDNITSLKKTAFPVQKHAAVIRRIDEAVKDENISKSTGNTFKKIADQVLAGKTGKTEKEVKAQRKKENRAAADQIADAILNPLGEAGKGIVKNEFPGVDKAIRKLLQHGADVVTITQNFGYDLNKAIDKAYEKVKEHPLYKNLVKSGLLNEDKFKKEFKDSFKKEPVEPTVEEEPTRQQTVTDGKAEPDIYGEKREHSIGKRIKGNPTFKKISDYLKDKGILYDSRNVKKATAYVNKLIEEYEANNALIDLADSIISGKTDIPMEIRGLAAAELLDKLNVIAENETNEFTKEATITKAADLRTWWMQEATKAGIFNGIANEKIASSMPSSKSELRAFAAKQIETLHDKLLTPEEISQIETAAKEINEMLTEENMSDKDIALLNTLVDKKIKEISDKINGKETADKITEMTHELLTDLTDC